MVKPQSLLTALHAVSQRNRSLFQIDAVHVRLQKVHMLEHLPQGTDNIRELQVAGSHLVQHGCEKNKVLTADEGHLDRRIGGECLVEMQGRIQAAKTAAKNHNPRADRGLVVFLENMAQPKMVNKPEVKQHHSKHQRSDKVYGSHIFPSLNLRPPASVATRTWRDAV